MNRYVASRTSHKRWRLIVTAITIVIIVAVVGGVVGTRQWYNTNLRPVASGQKSLTVVIPEGYSLKQIATLLKKDGVIRSDWAFTQYVRNKQADSDIKAGTYELSPSQSVQEIVSIITQGKIKTDLLTILPGQRLDQIRAGFIRSGFSSTDVDGALNPSQYSSEPALVDKPADASLEGYLYPDSFQKTASTTPQDIIRASLQEMQKQLTPDIRNAIQAQGLSVHDGIILASMVEQEANTQNDRNQVAQVFLKRLKDGMDLGSDVTAFYGAIINHQPKSVLYDSPYNTRLHPGLPVGPISNVSGSSLQAVAHPASTDYLYFFAGDDGTIRFSHTLEEFQGGVSQYCQKVCGQ